MQKRCYTNAVCLQRADGTVGFTAGMRSIGKHTFQAHAICSGREQETGSQASQSCLREGTAQRFPLFFRHGTVFLAVRDKRTAYCFIKIAV